MNYIVRTLAGSVLAVAGLVGCATPPKTADAKQAKEEKIEYVYYTPTGSHVPVRVRKDQLQTTDAQSQSDQEVLRRVQQMGAATPRGAGGP